MLIKKFLLIWECSKHTTTAANSSSGNSLAHDKWCVFVTSVDFYSNKDRSIINLHTLVRWKMEGNEEGWLVNTQNTTQNTHTYTTIHIPFGHLSNMDAAGNASRVYLFRNNISVVHPNLITSALSSHLHIWWCRRLSTFSRRPMGSFITLPPKKRHTKTPKKLVPIICSFFLYSYFCHLI